MKQNHRSFLERFKNIDSIKFNDFKAFVESFRSKLKLKILIEGNIVESRAQYITAMILSNLKLEKIDEIFESPKIYQLPLGASQIKLNSIRNNDHNSVIKNYYQIVEKKIRIECLAEFLVSLLTEPLFDILRTHEQLGYGISCCCRKNCGTLGITITVEYQENKNSSTVIDQKIEEFLDEFQNKLNLISDKDFTAAKLCFLSSRLSQETDLEIEANKNFEEMRNSEIIFNRLELEALEIKSITKEEIFNFYQEIFISKMSVRKLSIQIVGSSEQLSNGLLNGKNKSKIVNEKQNVMINDLKLFQESIKVGS